MVLESHDFKRIIDSPVNREALVFANADNERMGFHAKRATSIADASVYYSIFKTQIDKVLIPSKRVPFWNLFEWPLPSAEVISDASDELNKVFDAKDKIVEVNCSSAELEEEFTADMNRVLQFMKNDVFNAVLQRCNSVVLIDLPKEQTTALPEPYALILEAKEIYDIAFELNGDIKYLCIKKSDNQYYFVDEQFYHLVNHDGSIGEIVSSAHELGYCPAFAIWNDNITTGEQLRKLSPLLDILALLDNYVFKYIQKNFLDLYADSPILEKYESKCMNPGCVNGYIIKEDKSKDDCPDCKNRAFIGAGSILTKPVPNPGVSNISNAANWVPVPVESLKYTKEKLEGNYKRIFEFLTGYVKGGDKTEAVNQDQVYSQLESRKAKLSWWAENFEKVHKSILDTIGKLKHGSDYIESTVSYGRDFHLWNLDTALKEYEYAVKVGLPAYLTSQIRNNVEDLIIGKSNYKAKRIAILKLLEPYPDASLNMVQRDTVDFELKANFSGYINQFETRYGDIVNFASLLDLYTKIEKIKQMLIRFATDAQAKQIESRKKFLEITNVKSLNLKENESSH